MLRNPVIALIVLGIVLLSGRAWFVGTLSDPSTSSVGSEVSPPDAPDGRLANPTGTTTLAGTDPADQATRQAETTATALALAQTAQALDTTQTALADLERQSARLTQIAALEATAQSIQATQTSQAIAAQHAEEVARAATAQAEHASYAALQQTAEALDVIQATQEKLVKEGTWTDVPVPANTLMRANKDVRVHVTPGLDTDTLTILEHGYDAEILGDKRTFDDITWLKVRTVEDNVIGWVSNRYLRTIADMCIDGVFRRVQSFDLNMRSAPGRFSDNVTMLSQGERVELLGVCEQEEASIWAKVRTDQHVGWVNTRFLE